MLCILIEYVFYLLFDDLREVLRYNVESGLCCRTEEVAGSDTASIAVLAIAPVCASVNPAKNHAACLALVAVHADGLELSLNAVTTSHLGVLLHLTVNLSYLPLRRAFLHFEDIHVGTERLFIHDVANGAAGFGWVAVVEHAGEVAHYGVTRCPHILTDGILNTLAHIRVIRQHTFDMLDIELNGIAIHLDADTAT